MKSFILFYRLPPNTVEARAHLGVYSTIRMQTMANEDVCCFFLFLLSINWL